MGPNDLFGPPIVYGRCVVFICDLSLPLRFELSIIRMLHLALVINDGPDGSKIYKSKLLKMRMTKIPTKDTNIEQPDPFLWIILGGGPDAGGTDRPLEGDRLVPPRPDFIKLIISKSMYFDLRRMVLRTLATSHITMRTINWSLA